MDFSGQPVRYALAELVNIHEEAQRFEPIHRIVTKTDPEALLEAMRAQICCEEGCPLPWYFAEQCVSLCLAPSKGQLPVELLQSFLDEYLSSHEGEIDYIHGEEVLKELSGAEHAIGFVLPEIPKDSFFQSILERGVFPRKTFSTGHAREKRYYLEARDLTGEYSSHRE